MSMRPPALAAALLAVRLLGGMAVRVEHEGLLRGVDEAPRSRPSPRGCTFHLQEGVTHTLDSAQVDGRFCDASSLSYAGYMHVAGSKFDTDADKHLFYWFFEKRTTSQLPAEEDRPRVGFHWPWSKAKESSAPADAEEAEKQAALAAKDVPLVIWLTGGPGCSRYIPTSCSLIS